MRSQLTISRPSARRSPATPRRSVSRRPRSITVSTRTRHRLLRLTRALPAARASSAAIMAAGDRAGAAVRWPAMARSAFVRRRWTTPTAAAADDAMVGFVPRHRAVITPTLAAARKIAAAVRAIQELANVSSRPLGNRAASTATASARSASASSVRQAKLATKSLGLGWARRRCHAHTGIGLCVTVPPGPALVSIRVPDSPGPPC
jgi:hypothetical protein